MVYSAGPPTNGTAVGSLIAALVGLVLGFACLLPFLVGGIVAVILARGAKRDIRASGGTQGGEGLAGAAAIIGWVDIALGLLFIIGIIVLIALGIATATVHTYSQRLSLP